MRASAGRPLRALMMVAPLLAVPVLALSGVIQFVPLAGPPPNPSSEEDVDDLVETDVGDSVEYTPTELNELFRDIPAEAAAEPFLTKQKLPVRRQPRGEPTEPEGIALPNEPFENSRADKQPPPKSRVPEDALAGWKFAKRSSNGRAAAPRADEDRLAVVDQNGASAPKARATTASGRQKTAQKKRPRVRTMQDASDRLKQLGIARYRLESLPQNGRYLFTCSFTPDDNPRVTRRFEAEGDEPLLAVKRVLKQVEEWHTQQSPASDRSNWPHLR